jgi:parvulin-like peptidyl-prolyl isomerase
MKRMNAILMMTITLSLNISAQEKDSKSTIDFNAVIATVNGVEIKRGQFEQAYQQSLAFVSDKPVTRERVLNELIDREVGLKKAKESNLDQEPVIKAKMEDVLFHAQISKDLEGKLQAINVTDKDAEEYYNKNKEYRTAHILLRLRIVPQKEEFEEVNKKALEIYHELQKKPQAWPELAAKYSQAANASVAGDLGFVPAIKMAPEYFKAINEKKSGFITAPIHTQFGVHIIKVLAVHEWKEVDQAMYKKIVHDIKRDKILEDYFAQQRKSAQVKINKEYLK